MNEGGTQKHGTQCGYVFYQRLTHLHSGVSRLVCSRLGPHARPQLRWLGLQRLERGQLKRDALRRGRLG
jgi:hypothetical protein